MHKSIILALGYEATITTSDHDISLHVSNLTSFGPLQNMLRRIFWGPKRALSGNLVLYMEKKERLNSFLRLQKMRLRLYSGL